MYRFAIQLSRRLHSQARILQSYPKLRTTLNIYSNGLQTRFYCVAIKDEAKKEYPFTDGQEKVVGKVIEKPFQAETRKLLDIVASSLYSEQEVFIRELISNSSDALERLKHWQLTEGAATIDGSENFPLEIRIVTDVKNNTLIIQDTGIGMTEEDLSSNLGVIARSGTKTFLQQLEHNKERSSGDGFNKNFIGQFGVGFYSTFMVGDQIHVYSKHAKKEEKGHRWASSGAGTFEIAEAENVSRGTKIIIKLKENCKKFAEKSTVQNVIKKYSNFVNFPIYLNGERINNVQALWTMSRMNITDDQYKEFYHFIANTFDEPLYRLHHATDSPLQIQSLLFIPSQHTEKLNGMVMEPGVSLYSKKVLIENKSRRLFPQWLRFLKGIVDSEDISLNVSRELVQDSALLRRLSNIMTSRVLKWLQEEAKTNSKRYLDHFYREYRLFLKEGWLTDEEYKADITKLLRFETSTTEASQMISLQEYIQRMPKDQTHIYYLVAPNRHLAMDSPYLESLKAKNIEVIFCYDLLDEVIMKNMKDYEEKPLLSIEADLNKSEKQLTQEDGELTNWFKQALSPMVDMVKISSRLVQSPAVIVQNEVMSMQRLFHRMNPSATVMPSQYMLEINMEHPIIQHLNEIRTAKPELAQQVAEQLLDNALIAAGLLDDSRSMLKRINTLILSALQIQSVKQ